MGSSFLSRAQGPRGRPLPQRRAMRIVSAATAVEELMERNVMIGKQTFVGQPDSFRRRALGDPGICMQISRADCLTTKYSRVHRSRYHESEAVSQLNETRARVD